MRADSEHVFGNSIESLKDDTKSHQCPENNWEETELNIPKNGKEIACELFFDARGDKLDKENDRNMLGRNSSERMTDMTNGHSSAERDSLEKEGSVFYMDKNVMACDVPEISVCYKENTYHVVKDICVDEGVPVQEKFLSTEKDSFECGSEDPIKAVDVTVLRGLVTETSETKSSGSSPSKVQEHSDFCNAANCDSENLTTHGDIKDATDKTSERGKHIPDIKESSTRNCADAEESRKCNQENLIVTGEVKGDANCSMIKDMPTLDAPEISPKIDSEKHLCTCGESENSSGNREVNTAGITTKEPLTLADILSMEDGKKPFNHNSNRPEEQSSQESSGTKSSESPAFAPEVDEREDLKTPSQVSHVTGPGEASESRKANNGEANSSCSKNADATDLSAVSTSQESNKTMGPSIASQGDSETGLRTNEPQRPEPEYYMPRHNFLLEDPNDHPFSSHISSGFGETSFSAAESVSGHITYSGPIAYSGSLSVRSDGSTTSARSFAFPVLQSEWNYSPVRMAKADKRHLRRQRGWRHTLLCCRF